MWRWLVWWLLRRIQVASLVVYAACAATASAASKPPVDAGWFCGCCAFQAVVKI